MKGDLRVVGFCCPKSKSRGFVSMKRAVRVDSLLFRLMSSDLQCPIPNPQSRIPNPKSPVCVKLSHGRTREFGGNPGGLEEDWRRCPAHPGSGRFAVASPALVAEVRKPAACGRLQDTGRPQHGRASGSRIFTSGSHHLFIWEPRRAVAFAARLVKIPATVVMPSRPRRLRWNQ